MTSSKNDEKRNRDVRRGKFGMGGKTKYLREIRFYPEVNKKGSQVLERREVIIAVSSK